jgi:putative colanic acid biosynthesis UDP-glucose lipid carrier transferase
MAYAISISYVGIILDNRTVFIEKVLVKVIKNVILYFLILFGILVIMRNFIFPLLFWMLFFIILLFSVSSWRIIARLMLKEYRRKGGNRRNVVILGAGNVAKEVYRSIITNVSYGYNFLGFFDDRLPSEYVVNPDLVKGKIMDVLSFTEENNVDEIICALPAGDDRKALPIIKFAENNLIRCYIIPDFRRFLTKKVNLSFLEEIPIVSLRKEPLQDVYNRALKRSFDFICSGIFLITIFPPLFIIIGSIIKLSSPEEPIFFKQKRTGKKGKEFYCIKFRTMKRNNDADCVQASKDDQRITRVGAFLRKTNLDETPQFINVFFGSMSIVGPRPHMLKHTEMYSQLIDKYMVRHYAKPGITGWAQVTGCRGETKEIADMEARIRKDMWYIENWTFWLDIKIIFLTAFNMIKGEENAY